MLKSASQQPLGSPTCLPSTGVMGSSFTKPFEKAAFEIEGAKVCPSCREF